MCWRLQEKRFPVPSCSWWPLALLGCGLVKPASTSSSPRLPCLCVKVSWAPLTKTLETEFGTHEVISLCQVFLSHPRRLSLPSQAPGWGCGVPEPTSPGRQLTWCIARPAVPAELLEAMVGPQAGGLMDTGEQRRGQRHLLRCQLIFLGPQKVR